MYWKNRDTGGGADCPDGNRKSNTELLADIEEILASGSDLDTEDIDVDALEERLTELQGRAPVTEKRTAAELWKETKKQNPKLFADSRDEQEPAARKRSGFGLIHVAEIAAIVVVCLIVSARAFGYNPMNVLLEWADGVVGIYSGEQSNMQLSSEVPGEYRSFAEALTAYGIDTDDSPTWIPEDYSLVEVTAREYEGIIRIVAIYESTRGEILLRATLYDTETWATAAQRNEDGYVYPTAGNEYYYVMSNLEQMKAKWSHDQCLFEIRGQLSEEELLRTINSIPRGEKT